MPIGAPGRPLDPETLGDSIDPLYRAARGLCGSREEAENLSYSEAAGTLRVRQATVTTWLHRGRQRIAGALALPSSALAAPSAAKYRGDAA
ncbi:MAG: hypothetical protein JO179_02920 [Solirubrobacterales bacterium]|nr:hypothetical protein [Solirubrobacterales bacterium]